MNSKHGLLVVDDEDMDINVDDDEDELYKTTKSDSLSIGKFSFSITNILSDKFGTPKFKIEPDQSDRIFRPFEIKNLICNTANNSAIDNDNKSFVQNLNPSSVLFNSFRLSDIFDYSTKNLSNFTHENNNYRNNSFSNNKSDNSLRNSLYNSFTSYPKIQEEILNGHKKHYSSGQALGGNFLSSASALKIPSSIGGLCKTISQIGQDSLPPQSLSTSSSASSTSSSITPKSNSTDTLKLQQSSADSIDSDDCQSESSKDDQKMWPAWVSSNWKLNVCEHLLII